MGCGTPGPDQTCQTGVGGGVMGGDWCSYLGPDSWGLAQNTLFIYLNQHSFLQQVKKDTLLLVPDQGESLLYVGPFRNTLL